ncbi:hypothetical protein [Paenibacillus naphthalenovorans]|uniref:hypothetical protein n=1 Tax=Paenibacillus naphthalenovorans TaxID=162209 RepID=UPI003D2D7C5C
MDIFGVLFFLGISTAIVGLIIFIVHWIFKKSKRMSLIVLATGAIVSIVSISIGVATEDPAVKERWRIEQAANAEKKAAEKERKTAAVTENDTLKEPLEPTGSAVAEVNGENKQITGFSQMDSSTKGTEQEENRSSSNLAVDKTPESVPPSTQVNIEDGASSNEQFDFSTAELTEENVMKVLNEVDAMYFEADEIEGITFEEPGEVWIKSFPEIFWSEKDLVEQTGIGAVRIFHELFKNPDVNAVVINVWTSFVDQYGKESNEKALSIRWTREVSDKVNYKNFEDMVFLDYKKAFDIATSYTIHPGIAKAID